MDVWGCCPLMTFVCFIGDEPGDLLVTRVTMGWDANLRSLWRMKVSWDIEQATVN